MKKIKVLIGILGLDQHEVGAFSVATMLRDAGMEVVYLSKFNLPADIVRASIQEDVDVIGLSCHSWEYINFIPELIHLMKEQDVFSPIVVGGSVITAGDRKALLGLGVADAFGPGAMPDEIVGRIQDLAVHKHL
jgi:methylmalonyl-CoA mutase C-terminal domain/subunit